MLLLEDTSIFYLLSTRGCIGVAGDLKQYPQGSYGLDGRRSGAAGHPCHLELLVGGILRARQLAIGAKYLNHSVGSRRHDGEEAAYHVLPRRGLTKEGALAG